MIRNSQGINHDEIMVNGRLVGRSKRAKTEKAKGRSGNLRTNSISNSHCGPFHISKTKLLWGANSNSDFSVNFRPEVKE